MRTEALLLAALSLLGLASAVFQRVPHEPADNAFLLKQKRAYQRLWHVGQPSLYPELRQFAISYQLEEHIGDFKDPEVVKRFIKYYKLGYIQERGEQFSVYDRNGPLQAKALVDLLYKAKDFETVLKVAAWAREYLSADLFVYAFTVHYILRSYTYSFILPAPFEITPQRYVHQNVMREAWRATLEGKTFNKKQPYVIRVNYSSCYTPREDILLSYYTQDVSLLAFRDMYRYRNPFWARLADYNRYIRRGDAFYFVVKAILGRYCLERLSHHLPDIEPIDYEERVCGVRSYSPLIVNITTTEKRLWDAVDSGYVYDCEMGKYSLRDPLSSDIFGRIVEGNEESINKPYYGSLYYGLLAYAQQLIDSCDKYTVGSFFLHSSESVFRSPLLYKVLKRVALIMDRFKELLGPYSRKELWLPGVEVVSLAVDKMATYMEDFDFELNNGIPVANIEKGSKLMVIARQRRLNHKPFSYKVVVHSDKDIEVLVRLFIGPQYDAYGREMSLNEKRHYMMYGDSFICKLQKGKNELVRNSKDFELYNMLPLSYYNMSRLTESALAGEVHPFIDDFVRKVEYLEHLALPRGTRSGMALSAYVIITEYKPEENSWINPAPGPVSWFPFDRPIEECEFHVPNARFSETTVYHLDADDVTAA